MIEVIGGILYQWDVARQVKVLTFSNTINEVHFAKFGDLEALVIRLLGVRA